MRIDFYFFLLLLENLLFLLRRQVYYGILCCVFGFFVIVQFGNDLQLRIQMMSDMCKRLVLFGVLGRMMVGSLVFSYNLFMQRRVVDLLGTLEVDVQCLMGVKVCLLLFRFFQESGVVFEMCRLCLIVKITIIRCRRFFFNLFCSCSVKGFVVGEDGDWSSQGCVFKILGVFQIY